MQVCPHLQDGRCGIITRANIIVGRKDYPDTAPCLEGKIKQENCIHYPKEKRRK